MPKSEAVVKFHKSYGSVWKRGELIAGFERNKFYRTDKGRYTVYLCVEPREVGPKGGLRKPARMAEIAGLTWASVCRAVQSLGFTRPRLTATEVREGR